MGRHISIIASSLTVSFCLAALGCVVDADSSSAPSLAEPDSDYENADVQAEHNPAPERVDTAGSYELVNTLDLTVGAVLPEPAYETLSLLADFRDRPAETLFAVLEDAGVPLVGELLDVLPGPLEDRLMGWIDGYITERVFEDGPIADELDALIDAAEITLTRFDVVSELDLSAVDGEGDALHRLRALRFQVDGRVFDVEIPALGPVTETSVAVAIDRVGDASADLVIGDHSYGLPYGELAFSAIDHVIQERYGVDMRAALGLLVDCPALAQSVADRCALGLCVGHAEELGEICERGLDMVVDEVHGRFAELRFDAMHLAAGAAEMRDTTADGAVDTIEGGLWQAELNAGMGLREVPAAFTGIRLD